MPVLRSLTLAAYQACFRGSHTPNPNPGALSFCAGLDPAPEPRGLARMQGRLLCRLMELAESRQEALDRVCEYEQLAQSLSRGGDGDGLSSSSGLHPFGSHVDGTDAMDAESEGPLEQEEGGCPFATADTEMAIALSFNYGISLVDLEQEEMAEKFMARAVGLLAFASPAFRAAWTCRYAHGPNLPRPSLSLCLSPHLPPPLPDCLPQNDRLIRDGAGARDPQAGGAARRGRRAGRFLRARGQ